MLPPKRPHHVRANPATRSVTHVHVRGHSHTVGNIMHAGRGQRQSDTRPDIRYVRSYLCSSCVDPDRWRRLSFSRKMISSVDSAMQHQAVSACVCVCHVCNNMTWQHRHVARVRCRARRVTCCHCLQCLSRIAVAPGLTPLVRKQLLSSSGRAFPKGRTHGVLAGAQDCRTAN